MKILKAFLSLLMIAFLIITALFVDFAYKTFSASPRLVQADAIVVLAGGRGRVEEGIRLFREGKENNCFWWELIRWCVKATFTAPKRATLRQTGSSSKKHPATPLKTPSMPATFWQHMMSVPCC